jgi:hypothetical protein
MTTAEAARMPFGRFKNTPIEKIDPSYLEWVLANCQQISPDLRRAICTRLGLEVKDDPKDREIEALQQTIQELRHKVLVSRLEAYDEGYQDGKNENLVKKVEEWHQSLVHDYQRSTEAMTVVKVAHERFRKALEFKDALIDQESATTGNLWSTKMAQVDSGELPASTPLEPKGQSRSRPGTQPLLGP